MIYLDNAATSWPKPEETIKAMEDCIRHNGANPGRGGHKMSLGAGRIIFEARTRLARLFNARRPEQIVFTGNATESMNLALKGFLRSGNHVIMSSLEHNAVVRPLNVLKARGIETTEISSAPDGSIEPGDILKAIRKDTAAIVMTHASNVIGNIMPITEIGKVAADHGLCLMVDAAQTAGFLDIDVQKMNIDLLIFTGHKSLYGPQGTGGLYIREGLTLEPLKEGGTGSQSEMVTQPEELPDKFESGTPNTPGIAGLAAGVDFITAQGLAQVRSHEYLLLTRFIDGVKQIKGMEVYGPADMSQRVPVVSVNIKDQDSSEIAFIMDKVFNISCRSGLHCAPLAHRTIGTIDRGTVRFSFSLFNTVEEVDHTLEALEQTVAELL